SRLHIESNLQLPLPGSPVEQALTTRSIWVSQGVEAGRWEAALETGPDPKTIQTIVCAPLTTQNKDLGALLIWFHQPQDFSQHDTHMMTLFADQSALALNNARLHTLNRQLAIAQERQRLARDLHDSVTQTLYSIGLGAETALELISRQRSQDIHKPLAHIHQLTQIALKEIREQVHHLHPAAFADKTLGELLQTYCAMVHQQYGLTVELTIDPELRLSIYQRENLFYLAREALWNVIKHAQGAQVQLSLTQADQQAILTIADNGPGFVSIASTETQMYGLRSMRERAALLDASFGLDSSPNQGTRITVQIPLTLQSV
ncbi:MAG: GAF domain-containing sensor histidine kinase, partial [Anaerolineales bacterium]|nr:GAF domain-containing sensor histidine kinase [Anaerolineales bacterium]